MLTRLTFSDRKTCTLTEIIIHPHTACNQDRKTQLVFSPWTMSDRQHSRSSHHPTDHPLKDTGRTTYFMGYFICSLYVCSLYVGFLKYTDLVRNQRERERERERERCTHRCTHWINQSISARAVRREVDTASAQWSFVSTYMLHTVTRTNSNSPQPIPTATNTPVE